MADATSPEGGSTLRLLARGTTWQAVGQVVPLVLNLLLTPYFMKGLGLEIWGIFLLVNVVQLVLGSFDGGIGPSANRFFTIYAGRGDREATTALLTTLVLIISALATVVFGLFFALSPWIIQFFPVTRPDPDGSILLLRVLIVLVAMAQVRSLFAYVLFAQHKFGITTSMGLLGHVIYAVGMVLTVRSGAGLAGIAATFVLQQVVATLFIIPSTFRYLDRSGVRLMRPAEMRDFWGYSWKVQLSSLLDIVAMQGDMLIVSRFTPREQPLFGQGSNFAQQLRMVPMNAFSPIQAMVGRAVGGKPHDEAREDYHRIQRLWVVGVVGWVAAAAPASYFAVNHWLLASSRTARLPLSMAVNLPGQVAAILLIGHLFYLLSIIQIIWCLAVGRSDLELRYGIVSLVLNLTMTIALIIPYGVIGSIVATALSQAISSAVLSVLMRREGLDVRAPWRLIPWDAAALCASLSYLACWGLSEAVGDLSGGLALVLVGIGAAPALLVYLAVTGALTQLWAVVRRRRA